MYNDTTTHYATVNGTLIEFKYGIEKADASIGQYIDEIEIVEATWFTQPDGSRITEDEFLNLNEQNEEWLNEQLEIAARENEYQKEERLRLAIFMNAQNAKIVNSENEKIQGEYTGEVKRWELEISENGWEYTGTIFITAKKIELIDKTTILADGVKIEFNEEIRFNKN